MDKWNNPLDGSPVDLPPHHTAPMQTVSKEQEREAFDKWWDTQFPGFLNKIREQFNIRNGDYGWALAGYLQGRSDERTRGAALPVEGDRETHAKLILANATSVREWHGEDAQAFDFINAAVALAKAAMKDTQPPADTEKAAEQDRALQDLAMMIRKLCRRISLWNKGYHAAGAKIMADSALDLLRRHGLEGSAFRDLERTIQQPADIPADSKELVRELAARLERLNTMLDAYWNGHRSDSQVMLICDEQAKCKEVIAKGKIYLREKP